MFGGRAKAFEKYESGEVAPSSAMTRLLLLGTKRPDLLTKGTGEPIMSETDASQLREVVRKSLVDRILSESTIYGLRPYLPVNL